MNKNRTVLAGLALLAALFFTASVPAQTTYNQAATAAFAPAANVIEKSATVAPNIATAFSTVVAAAYATNAGGVFDLPTAVASGTTVYRATFGPSNALRLVLTSSVSMQNVTGTGSFTPVSGANATTSSANQSSYRLRVGPILDVATDLPVSQMVTRIGFAILARTDATYPCDIRATVSFSDGTASSATATVGNPKGSDDTFFGFTAPETLGITNLLLESFVTGTTTPVSSRVCWDDFGFITGPSYVPPAPTIYNINPADYALHTATNGVQFQVQSAVALIPGSITMVLNSIDVSAQLVLGGETTNRTVSFSGLLADQEYTLTITATNVGGASTVTRTFYTATSPFVLFDSHGFTNDTLYPLGPLQLVTDGRGMWTPSASEPSEFVDAGVPQGKVLQRLTTGVARADVLDFPPVSSGTIIIEFDAWVSTMLGRTIDVALQPLSGGNTMASFISWGELAGKLGYYDNVNWLPLADWADGWHRCKIINYLSGPAAGHYDVLVDNSPAGLRIPWRNAAAGTALGRFRYRSEATGSLFDYGRIDNLVITAALEDANVFLAPAILNVVPANQAIGRPQDGIRFEVTSAGSLSASNVAMLLDGTPAALDITGTANHLYAAYNQTLSAGNHSAVIHATNAVGTSTASLAFIATDEAWLTDPADGWAGPWQWASGQPELRTQSPIDGTGPYLRLDITNSAARNFMRQYQPGANVDLAKPYSIRWKCRLPEEDFNAAFVAFNDRVHFFARNAPRLTASTDAANTWAISATGAEQTAGSGVSAGQTFWIFDNVDGTGAYNLANLVNSQVQLFPHHVYAFEVFILPEEQSYRVKIVDETGGTSFQSATPHRFRATGVTPTSHAFLHFGVQTASSAIVRPFDLDSVVVVQAASPVLLLNPQRSGTAFSFSFVSRAGATHFAEYATELPPAQWHPVQTVTGDGSVKLVTDSNATGEQRYYRVRTQ